MGEIMFDGFYYIKIFVKQEKCYYCYYICLFFLFFSFFLFLFFPRYVIVHTFAHVGWLLLFSISNDNFIYLLLVFLLLNVLLVVLVCNFVVIKKITFYNLLKQLFLSSRDMKVNLYKLHFFRCAKQASWVSRFRVQVRVKKKKRFKSKQVILGLLESGLVNWVMGGFRLTCIFHMSFLKKRKYFKVVTCNYF